jgi:hypothetical protein
VLFGILIEHIAADGGAVGGIALHQQAEHRGAVGKVGLVNWPSPVAGSLRPVRRGCCGVHELKGSASIYMS